MLHSLGWLLSNYLGIFYLNFSYYWHVRNGLGQSKLPQGEKIKVFYIFSFVFFPFFRIYIYIYIYIKNI